ncbi:DUF2179 domain-containing protein [Candidatus Mycoplasma haematobovis]|uniref:DUF2179 domain-containing protein n=1 Tax=Candidatus Mycoplasma haematobovis TaxID=432608 RepID=UPI000A7AE384|nr:DUF2179 domain-containing protein [Candidatus Mycoplasma haematobovis]
MSVTANYVYQLNPKEIKSSRLSIGILKLQFLFDIEKFSQKIWIITAVSIFVGIYNFFLLERTGLYSLGINSVFQAIARCITFFWGKNYPKVHAFLFWGMVLIFNIPLAVLGYTRIGKNFTIFTLLFITVSTITSLILSSVSDPLGLKDFYIFSDPRTFNKCLKDQKINILQWQYVTPLDKGGKNYVLNDSSNISLIFFYGFIFGLLNTFTSLVIYALGGSTGGIDWLVFYLSKKKMNSTNNVILYFSLLITLFSYLVGTYIPYLSHMSDHRSNGCNGQGALNGEKLHKLLIPNIVGPILFATFIAAFTKKILFNLFYPHFKLVNVKIFTNKALELREILLASDFPHSFTINTATGGYLLRKQNVFEVICFALELKNIQDYTRKIDPNCLIVASPIKSLSGNFKVKDNLN